MNRHFSKVLSIVLCICMLASTMVVTPFAAGVDFVESSDNYYKVITKVDYELAPGIVESEIVLNNTAGTHRQVAHVVEVDTSNPYAKVIPSYKGMIPTPGNYGVQIMSEQAAFAEANGYGNVVAAMNLSLSWYDSAYYLAHPELYGEPLGYMILDGVKYQNSQGQTQGAQTCVVINFDEKNGEERPANMPKVEIRSTSSAITGWEEQVIPANFGFLVKDGKNQYKKDNAAANGASRSFVGVKADGTFVMVMNDGRQAPYSTGFTNYEMAEFMLSLGCVQAVNGDGGGSSAFLSQRPGEELKINCSPSDGAERPTTHGILVISTAPATGEFARANISSEHDYYTPNSVVEFDALGSDLVGTQADIPADAVWRLKDSSFGTITQDGVFTSNGKIGEVTVQILYNDKVVGEDIINIVMPNEISFTQNNFVIPNGQTVEIVINAAYNSKIVCIKSSDVKFVLSDNALGTINGFNFTAAPAGTQVEPGTLSATIGDITITANLMLGEATKIIYDFENTNISSWSIKTNYPQYGPAGSKKDANGNYYYNGQNELGNIRKVNASTGKVRNGNYALAVECDFTQIYETGYHSLNLRFPTIDCKDAVAIGFWMYVPYDARHLQIAFNGGDINNGELYNYGEGWHYFKTSTLKSDSWGLINFSIDDRACASTGNYYNYITEPNLNGKYTLYIDDISVDYSTAVADRVNPVVSKPALVNPASETSTFLTGQTVTDSVLNFEAGISDADTGVNLSTAKAYIDGKLVSCSTTRNKISIQNVKLSNGVHTVKFEVSDNAGNSAWATGKINVQDANNNAPTIKIVPKDPTADRLLVGSLYWLDVVATDVEKVNKVSMTFDLNNASTWEFDGIAAIDGFTAKSSLQADDNIATITLTKTGTVNASGEAVIASIPVRTWESHITDYEGYEDQTPAKLVSRGIIWAQSIEVALESGAVTFDDYTVGTFGMNDVLVDTELFFTNYSRASVAGAQAWINEKKAAGKGFHEHTETDVPTQDATCTEDGLKHRVVCEVCDSVVEWGTVIPAKGHDYDFVDGVLKCINGGELFNGVYTDGKTYVDGVVLKDGWVEVDGVKTYYVENGVKVTGAHYIDNAVCVFDEEGVYQPDTIYTGFCDVDDTVMYFENNKYVTGYRWINTIPYNFDENGLGLDGKVDICGTTCLFENGVSVATEDVVLAGYCGSNAYFILACDGTLNICGSGAMLDLSNPNSSPWWKQEIRNEIKKIVIGKDITKIGRNTFVNMIAEEVVFEEGSKLTAVGRYTFVGMDSLIKVTLPEGLTTIESNVLFNCKTLRDVYLPSTLVSIGKDTFTKSPDILLIMEESAPILETIKATKLNYRTYVGNEPFVKYTGECGENVTWELYSTGKLVISGEGAMTDFAAAGTPWYKYRNEITSAEIGAEVTTIGAFTFYNCLNLASLDFAEDSKVETLGKGAIGLTGLTEVVLPDSVKTLAAYALYNNASLETVFIPEGVREIHANTFANTPKVKLLVAEGSVGYEFAVSKNIPYETREALPFVKYDGECGENVTWELYSTGKLVISGDGAMTDFAAAGAPWYAYRKDITSVTIGADITTIGAFAFYNCVNLETVTFEDESAVESIGKGAIGYTAVTEITLPDAVKTLAAYALYNNASLETVYIPEGVKSIYSNTFANTPNVKLLVAEGSYGLDFAVSKNIPYETREAAPFVKYEGECGENAVWELYSTGVLVISGEGAMTDFAAAGAPWYSYRREITSATIGADITTIGAFAFYNCVNLESVTFAEGSKVEALGKGAIGYTAITEITLPDSVKTLAAYALYNNASLVTVYIPEATTSIYTNTFANTPNVKLLVAEGSAGYEYAVSKNIPYETREAAPFVKYEGECGENVAWELYSNGVLKITGEGAMTDFAAAGAPWYKYRKEITSVEIDADIITIGAFAFYNCENLAEVTFAQGSVLETIGRGAIGYTAITEITIPASVTTLVKYALYYNETLESVTFEEGSVLSSIEGFAFRGTTALTTVTGIPAGTTVSSNAFYESAYVYVAPVVEITEVVETAEEVIEEVVEEVVEETLETPEIAE